MTPGSPGLFGGLALRGAGLALPGLPILAPRRPSRFEGAGDTAMAEVSGEASSAASVRDTIITPVTIMPVTARVASSMPAVPLSVSPPSRLAPLPQASDRVVPDRPRDEAPAPSSLPIARTPHAIIMPPPAEPPARPVADAALSRHPAAPVIETVAQTLVMSVAAPDPVPAPTPPAQGAPPPHPPAPLAAPMAIPREPPPPPVSVTISRLEVIFDAPPPSAPPPRPPAPNRARGFQAYARARSGMPR